MRSRSSAMVLIREGDIVDLTISEPVEMRNGKRNLKFILWSLTKSASVVVFATESAIGLKTGRITKILAVRYFPWKSGMKYKHFCNVICEMEDAEGETPNLIAGELWIDHQANKPKGRSSELPVFKYGGDVDAEEKKD